MLRFSLASLFALVLFTAIGSAALANSTDVWRQTIVTVAVATLLVATLAALVRRGQSKVLSLGFAVSGWIYLLLVFVSALGLRDDLLTDKALTYLFATIHGEASPASAVWQVAFAADGKTLTSESASGTVKLWDASTGQIMSAAGSSARFRDFADIGHSLWVVIIGCLGGVVAVLLRNQKRGAAI